MQRLVDKLMFGHSGRVTAYPDIMSQTSVLSGLATIVCHEHEKLARADRA